MGVVERIRAEVLRELDAQEALAPPLRTARSEDVMCNVYKTGGVKLRHRVKFRSSDEGVRRASKDVSK